MLRCLNTWIWNCSFQYNSIWILLTLMWNNMKLVYNCFRLQIKSCIHHKKNRSRHMRLAGACLMLAVAQVTNILVTEQHYFWYTKNISKYIYIYIYTYIQDAQDLQDKYKITSGCRPGPSQWPRGSGPGRLPLGILYFHLVPYFGHVWIYVYTYIYIYIYT